MTFFQYSDFFCTLWFLIFKQLYPYFPILTNHKSMESLFIQLSDGVYISILRNWHLWLVLWSRVIYLFSQVAFLIRINLYLTWSQSKSRIQSASVHWTAKLSFFCDDSSECFWLAEQNRVWLVITCNTVKTVNMMAQITNNIKMMIIIIRLLLIIIIILILSKSSATRDISYYRRYTILLSIGSTH